MVSHIRREERFSWLPVIRHRRVSAVFRIGILRVAPGYPGGSLVAVCGHSPGVLEVSAAARLPSVPVIGNLLSGLPRTSAVIRHWNHKYMGVAIAISGSVGLVLAPPFLVGYFFVPAVLLLLPWHDRVVLRRRDGERIVLRDLQDPDFFVRAVRENSGVGTVDHAA